MCSKRKKNSEALQEESIKILDNCLHQASALSSMLPEGLTVKSELESIKSIVRNLLPAENAGESKLDNNLNSKIGDLKIEINKSLNSGKYEHAEKLIFDIKIILAERKKGFNE